MSLCEQNKNEAHYNVLVCGLKNTSRKQRSFQGENVGDTYGFIILKETM